MRKKANSSGTFDMIMAGLGESIAYSRKEGRPVVVTRFFISPAEESKGKPLSGRKTSSPKGKNKRSRR